VRGAVQGVGFRPFVYRLAADLDLSGWVLNDVRGVELEVEGPRPSLETFLARLTSEAPPLARVREVDSSWAAATGGTGFEIRYSHVGGRKTVLVLPDVATCGDCRAEVLDPAQRRYRYPFTNCTACGPRFTIVRELPYDRPATTMAGFPLCVACRAEYDDPRDRRFHAQPIACPACGPRLALRDPSGGTLAREDDALRRAAEALGDGRIVAVKGLGGFHLMCDALDDAVVRRLRQRKRRLEKPLALMARDLGAARELCDVPEDAARLLASAEAPIVLLARREGARVAPSVAPGRPDLGVMLAATPLHHLLLADVGGPLVATSGNLHEEPICIDEGEAVERLGGLADLLLVHDRPIERHADDSVARAIRGEARLLRRARGYAPLPVFVPRELPTILAVGGHLKSTVALALGRQVFLSQHLGDLETPQARAAFERALADLLRLYGATPVAVAHDLHPGYVSTAWALASGLPAIGVQHHHAHLAACLAENGVEGRALGVTWDGTGYGTDGTIWGGEHLLGSASGFTRVAHLRPFRLPGGDAAVREPRRSALALLWERLGEEALSREDLAPVRSFTAAERGVLGRMLERGLNAPVTTSAGRLFDGVAALLGLHPVASHEGQAAMALETLAAEGGEAGSYPLPLVEPAGGAGALVLDWGPLLDALLADLVRGAQPAVIAARFHAALADGIVAVAKRVGEPRVALTGGCFQNRLLTERAADGLEAAGFEVLLHRLVPAGDGGISLGQAMVAAASGA